MEPVWCSVPFWGLKGDWVQAGPARFGRRRRDRPSHRSRPGPRVSPPVPLCPGPPVPCTGHGPRLRCPAPQFRCRTGPAPRDGVSRRTGRRPRDGGGLPTEVAGACGGARHPPTGRHQASTASLTARASSSRRREEARLRFGLRHPAWAATLPASARGLRTRDRRARPDPVPPDGYSLRGSGLVHLGSAA